MGQKTSRLLTYEDAVKRLTDTELRRMQEAFKKFSKEQPCITKESFFKNVLGEAVPDAVAEHIFSVMGGTNKGILLKELVCGLVLITRGEVDEKIKFLFELYSMGSAFIVKEDFTRLLQATESVVPDVVLFTEGRERVTYEEFHSWLLANPNILSLSRWILTDLNAPSISNDQEPVSLYKTLAGVTHLVEREIVQLEKRYAILKNESSCGKLDLETLRPLISPPMPLSVCAGFFSAFDENRDNHIDFKEMACGVSAAARGPVTERLKFCFKVFDVDRDGYLSNSEVEELVTVFIHMHLGGGIKYQEMKACGDWNDGRIISELRSRATEKGLSVEEFLIWAVDNPLVVEFVEMIFQVCHVVLGLLPLTEYDEGWIVRGWLEREVERGFSVGQFWYLVASDWWHQWLRYVTQDKPLTVLHKITGSVSNLTNLSLSDGGSGGSLKRVTQRITGGTKRSIIENCVALETSPNVVVTGITQLDSNPPASPSPSPSPSTPRRSVAKPGPIDNSGLVAPPSVKVGTLTGEGGKLKKIGLAKGTDFELVPDALWKALSQWYGGSPALPRQVILSEGSLGVELFPLTVKLLLHQTRSQAAAAPQPGPSESKYAALNLTPAKRYLAYLATFSRMATVGQVYSFLCKKLGYSKDNMRLWFYRSENNMVLMEDTEATLSDIGICDEDEILVEIRNDDLSWPEEIIASVSNERPRTPAVLEKGCTGLQNLGNTCYLNASVQCVSNTKVLTRYFTGNFHIYELNRINPSGSKGHIANKFGELLQELWGGTRDWCPPMKLRQAITCFFNRFEGNSQHDAFELLNVLLDALSEDLNRVSNLNFDPRAPTPGLPDIAAAQEAHEHFILRNKSIINDVFSGQIKSTVKCLTCSRESVKFESFNTLTLPLPLDTSIHLLVIVIKLDGSVPIQYSIKLNSEEKNVNLKQHLSCLCNVSPFFLKLAEISGSKIQQYVLQDESKVREVPQGCELYAYELPAYAPSSVCDEERVSINSLKSQSQAAPGVPLPVPVPVPVPVPSVDESASAASISTSASPTEGEPMTLLGGMDSVSMEGVQSDSIQVDSGNCSASNCSLAESMDTSSGHHPHNFIVAFNRKLNVQEVYFMTAHKSVPVLFGLPLIVPCSESTTHRDLYQAVLRQLNRLVSPLPPSETAPPNHAMDCDDSLGYEFPFILKSVNKEGSACSICPWTRFCQGCSIPCSDTDFNFSSGHIGIDWDATALYLRYQPSQERAYEEHVSVAQHRQSMFESLSLAECFREYTKEEMLGEESRYDCERCSTRQLASVKYEIWKLPPCLIVILKRFEYDRINNKWDKSQSIVDFPFEDFDPTEYLAEIPRNTVLQHRQNLLNSSSSSSECDHPSLESKRIHLSASAEAVDGPLQDFHQHLLNDNADPFNLKYNLYAYATHSGTLQAGHYMAYAQNPNTKWYCYNDSSCKEVKNMDSMNQESAYMLFYERQGLNIERYMPSIVDRDPPDLTQLHKEEEEKGCSVM